MIKMTKIKPEYLSNEELIEEFFKTNPILTSSCSFKKVVNSGVKPSRRVELLKEILDRMKL